MTHNGFMQIQGGLASIK